ncbi:MAG: hypothetical protein DMG23_06050 [Acidobacteria bacterium]|nr:MAG: hypothetical protein DMG23_06050 [Acidobacteriota bacterium]
MTYSTGLESMAQKFFRSDLDTRPGAPSAAPVCEANSPLQKSSLRAATVIFCGIAPFVFSRRRPQSL